MAYIVSGKFRTKDQQFCTRYFSHFHMKIEAFLAFDNSSNHAAFRSDTLVVNRMNLKPGGKQPKMRNTVFKPNNQNQSMVNENSEQKGMKQVLIERGLWKNGLNADCQLCKDKIDDENRVDCCARWIISLQLDFLAQKKCVGRGNIGSWA